MAAGFGESYIRLWSLTGKGLKQLRTDLKGDEVGKIHDGAFQLFSFFTPSRMRGLTLESNTAADLKKLYHPSAPQTRKLIAHSGPVYSLSFDPVPGPASPPRYLLSCSSDTTIDYGSEIAKLRQWIRFSKPPPQANNPLRLVATRPNSIASSLKHSLHQQPLSHQPRSTPSGYLVLSSPPGIFGRNRHSTSFHSPST